VNKSIGVTEATSQDLCLRCYRGYLSRLMSEVHIEMFFLLLHVLEKKNICVNLSNFTICR